MVHSGRRLKNEEICTAQILHGFHLGVVVGLQRRGSGRRSSRSLSVWRRGRGEGRNKFIYPNMQANKQTNKYRAFKLSYSDKSALVVHVVHNAACKLSKVHIRNACRMEDEPHSAGCPMAL